MNNKKLIFILGSPRSGTTLLLSYLCGIPNTKVLYETQIFKGLHPKKYISNYNYQGIMNGIAKYFDSLNEEIVIEKTPEHCLHLEDIEKLRKLCKRNIYVIYVVRPPLPTILSLLKASKDNPRLFGDIDLLGACEKYEESLISIYNNLILKSNRYNTHNIIEEDGFVRSEIPIPYSFCVTYRDLTENPLRVIRNLKNCLLIEADIQSLIDNRINNITKYLFLITTERHHVNVLRDIEEVEVERKIRISKQIKEGVSNEYMRTSGYIQNYFEHPITKETVYDLIVNKKVLEVKDSPEVYVLVPLYNKQNYIEETLSSIANQTYKNIRVVIIDDASTDRSYEVAERFIASLNIELRDKFSLIRYYNNQGVSFIRNKGLLINTDIISFCDADDIWDSELVQKSVNTFIRYPYIDCVYSRVLYKRGNIVEKDYSKICSGNVFKDAIKFNFLTCGSNLFIKKQVIEDNNLEFDLSFNGVEDWDFLIQLSKAAIFKCTKEYLVTYRKLENSLSSNKKEQISQGKVVLNKYIKDKKEFSNNFTRLFLYYFSFKNINWENIQDLDFRFILEVVTNKCKSIVKSYLS